MINLEFIKPKLNRSKEKHENADQTDHSFQNNSPEEIETLSLTKGTGTQKDKYLEQETNEDEIFLKNNEKIQNCIEKLKNILNEIKEKNLKQKNSFSENTDKLFEEEKEKNDFYEKNFNETQIKNKPTNFETEKNTTNTKFKGHEPCESSNEDFLTEQDHFEERLSRARQSKNIFEAIMIINEAKIKNITLR
ncbi:MAG: hypothetical protein LBJ09_03290 [Clostridiales bacterium]|jgi:hypothetical protein|nr:hypothetical protein [Clostridiales bacterium]